MGGIVAASDVEASDIEALDVEAFPEHPANASEVINKADNTVPRRK
jgi:hypothetical protein